MPAKLVAILLWVFVVRYIFSKSTNPPGVSTASPILMDAGGAGGPACFACGFADWLEVPATSLGISGATSDGFALVGVGPGETASVLADISAILPVAVWPVFDCAFRISISCCCAATCC